jgi:hypothetical protein
MHYITLNSRLLWIISRLFVLFFIADGLALAVSIFLSVTHYELYVWRLDDAAAAAASDVCVCTRHFIEGRTSK